MQEILVRKYIIDIVFVVVTVSLLTWFWFGPCKDRVRIKESLVASNIEFNKDISYSGFDYLELDNNKITKDLEVTNEGDKDISFIINFDNLTNEKNNYINYIIIDNEGYQSDVRSLSLDGYILENNITKEETKTYKIIMWSDTKNIKGNLNILLNPTIA